MTSSLHTRTEALGVPLTGRRVGLEPLGPQHVGALYDIATSDATAGGWPLLGHAMPEDEFADYLWSLGSLQFAIVRRDTGATVGVVQGIDEDQLGGTIGIGLIVDPVLWHAGWPLEAVVLFLDFLFCGRGCRKVYCNMPSSVHARLGPNIGRWFETECVYRRHTRIADRYEDQYVLAMTRARWDPGIARALTGNATTSPE